MSNQLLYEERESLASVRFQLEECRRDNQIKLNKVKTELASKTEEFHRQVKKEKVWFSGIAYVTYQLCFAVTSCKQSC